jgi:hypothetical protein
MLKKKKINPYARFKVTEQKILALYPQYGHQMLRPPSK